MIKRIALILAVAVSAHGADITPGYTFTSGEKNITHTKLNNAAAGTINTSFLSGKSSAGADPNTAFEVLLRDTSLDTFKRTTLAAGFFDHSALLASRTAKTAPVLADLIFLGDSAAANAYKQITLTNLLFSGASTSSPTNETLLPALLGGTFGSLSLSNLLGKLTSHSLATNGDALMVLTENGRAVKQITLQNIVTGAQDGTNFSGQSVVLSWDGTRLRSNKATNMVLGLTASGGPVTNDYVALWDSANGDLRKADLDQLRRLMRVRNLSQSQFTNATTLAFNTATTGFSNIVNAGAITLSNAITPTATSSKILVRLVLHAAVAGAANPAQVRILRDTTPIGLGEDDGANRTEAGATIENGGQLENTVLEWLDSPSTVSAVSYAIQVRADNSATIYFNRTQGDGNSAPNSRTVSTLTLEEIYQ